MLIPMNIASANLKALAYSIVASVVSDDDIAALCECRNHTNHHRKIMSVDDAGFRAEEGGYLGFYLHMYILRAVELWGAARSNTVLAQRPDGTLLDVFIDGEVVEVVRSKVCYRVAVVQLAPWSCRAFENQLKQAKNDFRIGLHKYEIEIATRSTKNGRTSN